MKKIQIQILYKLISQVKWNSSKITIGQILSISASIGMIFNLVLVLKELPKIDIKNSEFLKD